LSYILKELFGDTKRVSILEELIEREGEPLSVSEISRMAEVSKKTAYLHLSELEDTGIIIKYPGTTAKYGLNMDDQRAIGLSMIADEEYLRKIKISIEEKEKEELTARVSADIETNSQYT